MQRRDKIILTIRAVSTKCNDAILATWESTEHLCWVGILIGLSHNQISDGQNVDCVIKSRHLFDVSNVIDWYFRNDSEQVDKRIRNWRSHSQDRILHSKHRGDGLQVPCVRSRFIATLQHDRQSTWLGCTLVGCVAFGPKLVQGEDFKRRASLPGKHRAIQLHLPC